MNTPDHTIATYYRQVLGWVLSIYRAKRKFCFVFAVAYGDRAMSPKLTSNEDTEL